MDDPLEPLRSRLADLEERVTRLEGAAPTGDTSSPTAADPRFAPLEELKRNADPQRGAVLFTGVVPLPTGEVYEWQQGAEAAELTEADWSEVAPALDALGHPVRLRLLQLVLTGTYASADLKEDPTLGTTGQLYHHLRQLVAAGWLHSTGRGRYRVPPQRVIPLLVVLAAGRS
ncbi:ArsR family transcriptional regulator [Marinactinospora thermotolerans]|uniref:Helix-turn-helix domain-containing protein n=1 Tax=Marinactinospora thermotolerans DSM 45154 TaxID=1122192 RepID=A0A1T4K9X1_9ACTN|nr:ArsR family transcriptional regulator [Marinactinospora thermotolerans]SJZ39113.1 hypothetical protein SAMN02745673_00254 [Marinactinospora thermotolerans DSM 45154]